MSSIRQKLAIILSIGFLSTVNVQAHYGWLDYISDNWEIAKGMVRNPTEVAAFTASSPRLVSHITNLVYSHMANTLYDPQAKGVNFNILEAGSASGSMTRGLTDLGDEIKKEGNLAGIRLDSVEYLKLLYEKLKKNVQENNDPAKGMVVKLHCADISTWQRPTDKDGKPIQYDVIVSTIPMTRLPKPMITKILDNYLKWLKPGGKVIYISLLGAETLGKFVKSCQRCFDGGRAITTYDGKMTLINEWKHKNFSEKTSIVWLNLTPMLVYEITKIDKKKQD